MIIGFDGSRAFLKDRTGTENYSYQLLKHLLKIDTQNHYKVYVRPDTQINLAEFKGNVTFVNINFKRLWTQAGLSLQTFKDKLDVLFVPAHTLPIIKNPNLKTVVTVHDLGAEYLPKMHQLKQRLYLNFMTHKQLNSATKIISVSKATKIDLIKKAKIDPKKVTVIYEGVDFNIFKPLKIDVINKVLRHYEIDNDSYLLFVGTIQPRKNIERLIRAFHNVISNAGEESKDIKLVLAGGKGWLSDEIFALPKKLGIEDKVMFLGRVKDEDLPALYSGALGFVYPSLFEGFGLPILEAMVCETPVLTSNLSSMPEVAGNSAILVDPYDIVSISKGIQKLVDKNERSKLIKKGKKQVKKFTWEKAAKETLEVLTKLK